jgi:hypothetical protein
MKCRQAQELMGAYLYGDLAPDQMRDLRVHTQDCAVCREDLAARGRVVSSLGDATPQLSETDRQRIAWSVKGAISSREVERRPLVLRFAPAVALAAAVLVAGFALGRIAPHSPRHLTGVRQATKVHPVPHATVQVKEKLPAADKISETADKLLGILDSMSNAAVIADPNRQTTLGSRHLPNRHEAKPPRDGGVRTVPDAATAVPSPLQPDVGSAGPAGLPKESAISPKNTETGTDLEQTKLPKVTGPKNAETTPSEPQ